MEEQSDHINLLELKAAFFTLKCFCQSTRNVHVRLMMDNTAAVGVVNNYGSMKLGMMAVSNIMFEWAISRNIQLTAAYIPGKENVLADKESRTHVLEKEWKLKVKWFNYLISTYGRPSIDLFASRINKQLDCYVSWRPDPGAKFIDAFSQSWHGLFIYAFPPFSVIARVLQKMERDRVKGILIYPNWATQPWFARLAKMRIGEETILPWDCLCMPQNKDMVHPLHKRLHLRACLVSGICI